MTYRTYKKVDVDLLVADITASDLSKNPKSDINEQVEQYNNILSDIINTHAPLKTRTKTVRPSTPWFNEEIQSAKVERRKWESKWRQTGLTVFLNLFKHTRNKTTMLIAKAKTAFYTEKVDGCGNDQKALFRIIDEILGRKKERSLPPNSSLKDVLDRFSTFFHSKISNIRRNLDTENDMITSHHPTVLPVNDPTPTGILSTFTPLTTDDVLRIIMKSPTKSCELDPIPTWLLKKIVDSLLPTITDIINKSVQTSVFPPALKHARVTPLLKKPSLDKSELKNYRPVSNLAFISKILEKAVLRQFTEHLERHSLFCPIQSAYRPLHSTETALLKIQNDILLTLDNGRGVILVLLDLSAAFDTIDHEILVSRLQSRFGIKGQALAWFHSYLEERYQSVSVDGVTSEPTLLIYGVPQGSVFGPVDFITYLNPTYDIAIRHDVNIHQYADDTQLYLAFDLDKQDEAVEKMEACINDIRTWMRINKLKLNEDKTELLVIKSNRLPHKITVDKIQIGDCMVRSSPTARNLGAIFDDTMSLKPHVTSVVKSCNFQLRSLGKARKYLTNDATEKIIHAFISSRLDSGNSLLKGLPVYHIERLQRIQNTAARILTRTKKYQHISPIIRSLHWLRVSDRIEYKILSLTYKCIHNMAPEYIKNMIEPYSPSRVLRSQNQLLLKVPKTKLKTYGDRAFSKCAPALWNSLPHEIKSADTLDTFQSRLKTHFLKENKS
jgi:hypothetical protein